MSIAENIQRVAETMRRAAERSERDLGGITLVAVSKTVDVSEVEQAYRLGLRDFGENRPQELERKAALLKHLAGIRWHMIGHLQRNKVKTVLSNAGPIHSVDSPRLLEEIARRSADMGLRAEVLLEVNISGEESKFGLEVNGAIDLCKEWSDSPNLSIVGLMTMAPFVDDPEEARPVFAGLRQLRDRIQGMGIPGVSMCHLSMGMSNDYPIAIEEGATLIRVGTAIWQGC